MNSAKTTIRLLLAIFLVILASVPSTGAKNASVSALPADNLNAPSGGTILRELEDHDHEGEGDHDHGHEEEAIATLEDNCRCMEGNIMFCSDVDSLKHCHCEGDGHLHCETDEDHYDDHDEHAAHDHANHSGHGHDGEESDSSEFTAGDKPWGFVIGASILVNLTTLTGVVVVGGHWTRNLLCPSWKPNPTLGHIWTNLLIPMFAAGTLLATTFFLLLPEALHIIGDGLAKAVGEGANVEESQITWRWGASIMGGFLFPVLLHACFPSSHGHHDAIHTHVEAERDETSNRSSEEIAEEAATAEVPVPMGDLEKEKDVIENDGIEYITICGCIRLKELPLFLAFNLGEMLHNFTDGIFIGAAYLQCGSTVGNSVALATILHEIPNQLAGYLVMVHQNGIRPVLALFLNFMFGLSILAGALVVLVLTPGDITIGCIFSIGGGIFLHVAIFEMLGHAERHVVHKRDWGYAFLAFLIGAVLIGMVLINHKHCGGHDH